MLRSVVRGSTLAAARRTPAAPSCAVPAPSVRRAPSGSFCGALRRALAREARHHHRGRAPAGSAGSPARSATSARRTPAAQRAVRQHTHSHAHARTDARSPARHLSDELRRNHHLQIAPVRATLCAHAQLTRSGSPVLHIAAPAPFRRPFCRCRRIAPRSPPCALACADARAACGAVRVCWRCWWLCWRHAPCHAWLAPRRPRRSACGASRFTRRPKMTLTTRSGAALPAWRRVPALCWECTSPTRARRAPAQQQRCVPAGPPLAFRMFRMRLRLRLCPAQC
jgi:hypothetical protein